MYSQRLAQLQSEPKHFNLFRRVDIYLPVIKHPFTKLIILTVIDRGDLVEVRTRHSQSFEVIIFIQATKVLFLKLEFLRHAIIGTVFHDGQTVLLDYGVVMGGYFRHFAHYFGLYGRHVSEVAIVETVMAVIGQTEVYLLDAQFSVIYSPILLQLYPLLTTASSMAAKSILVGIWES